MDKEFYRLVPFRFAFNDSNADICKLAKLTNLFPDMKAIIELELFKINNLTHMINRLSDIYTLSSVIDTRDDTLHLFLGPYHLSLGPAMFGAMHFRNISTALLASSQSKISNDNINQYQKRRHDAVLRRFRRAVRKLIQIKSIVDKLRLASILTPYNQYELYTRGIYDLVLAGHMHGSDSMFIDDDFIEQVNDLRSMSDIDEKNPLVASKYIKINTLLHLLSPSPHHSENNSTPGKISQTRPDNVNTFTTNENSSQSLLSSTTVCCQHHSQNASLMMFPINRSVSQQSIHPYTPESRSKRSSTYNSRTSSTSLPHQVIANSLPDLTSDDNFNTNIPLDSHTHTSNKSKSLVSTNQENAFVNRISSLLTNYLLSQQSTSSHTNDHQKNSVESTDSLSSLTTAIGSDDSLSTIEANEFDKLLQRIKTVVDNNLSHNSLKTTNNHPQKLSRSQTTSYQKLPPEEFHIEPVKSSRNKRKLQPSSASQSFDDEKLKFHSTIPELNDTSVEF